MVGSRCPALVSVQGGLAGTDPGPILVKSRCPARVFSRFLHRAAKPRVADTSRRRAGQRLSPKSGRNPFQQALLGRKPMRDHDFPPKNDFPQPPVDWGQEAGIPRDPGYPKTRGTPGPRVPRDPGHPGTYHNNFSRRVRRVGGVRDCPLVLFPTFENIDSLSFPGPEIGPESMHF